MASLIIPKGNVFPVKKSDGEQIKPLSNEDNCWTWSRERYLQEKKKSRFVFRKSKNSPFLDENKKQSQWTVYTKIFEEDLENKRNILSDFISDYSNSLGTARLKEININFQYPKPVGLIKHLIERVAGKNSTVLDSFAGSGTTADAVLELNKEDGGSRKFILRRVRRLRRHHHRRTRAPCHQRSPQCQKRLFTRRTRRLLHLLHPGRCHDCRKHAESRKLTRLRKTCKPHLLGRNRKISQQNSQIHRAWRRWLVHRNRRLPLLPHLQTRSDIFGTQRLRAQQHTRPAYRSRPQKQEKAKSHRFRNPSFS